MPRNHQYDYGKEATHPGDTVIPFGKYLGTKLRDIEDLTYLDWMLGQSWLKEPLKGKVKAFLEIPTNRRDLEEQLEAKGHSR